MAIVVPDVDVVKCWALENKIPGTLSVLCNNPEVKQLIMQDMIAWGKEAGLSSFEQVIFFFQTLGSIKFAQTRACGLIFDYSVCILCMYKSILLCTNFG